MKFEDKMRDKLEERQLQPSENAWDKLSAQLDHKEKGSKKSLWWLGVAASIVGVFLTMIFLNENEVSGVIEPVIVETKDIDPINKKDNNELKYKKLEVIVEGSNAKRGQTTKEKIYSESPINKVKKNTQKLVASQLEEAVAVVPKEKIKETPKKTLSFEEQKANEVVAKIKAIQKQSTEVTEDEINALLAQAQKEIRQKKLYDDATKKVDANALLQSVENDLEKSFRDRVFEMLGNSYQNIKTAVAERNN